MCTDVKLTILMKYSGNGRTIAISQYQAIFSPPTWPGNEARVQHGPYIPSLQPHSNSQSVIFTLYA